MPHIGPLSLLADRHPPVYSICSIKIDRVWLGKNKETEGGGREEGVGGERGPGGSGVGFYIHRERKK